MTDTSRFHALDGLRGICAVLVLFYHTFLLSPLNPVAHGYLSVDVFFVLSGFVLAYAFGDRLENGMGAMAFMRIRIRRLGPVIAFAAAFSVAAFLLAQALGGPAVPFFAVMLAGIQSLLLIPMVGASGVDAFPLNGPIWSLFAEFWINLGFALIAARLRLSILAAIIAASGLFLTVLALRTGSEDFGATQSTILYAIPRAIPTFASGVLVFKLWRMGALSRLPSINPMLVFIAWIAISMVPAQGPAFDLVQTLLIAPVIVALLANSKSAAPGWSLWLGRISYPLYATHAVIIYTGQHLAHGALPLWALIVLPGLAIALADMLARWYEPAFRRIHRFAPGAPVPLDLLPERG